MSIPDRFNSLHDAAQAYENFRANIEQAVKENRFAHPYAYIKTGAELAMKIGNSHDQHVPYKDQTPRDKKISDLVVGTQSLAWDVQLYLSYLSHGQPENAAKKLATILSANDVQVANKVAQQILKGEVEEKEKAEDRKSPTPERKTPTPEDTGTPPSTPPGTPPGGAPFPETRTSPGTPPGGAPLK